MNTRLTVVPYSVAYIGEYALVPNTITLNDAATKREYESTFQRDVGERQAVCRV
jgi:hypothetical protein